MVSDGESSDCPLGRKAGDFSHLHVHRKLVMTSHIYMCIEN